MSTVTDADIDYFGYNEGTPWQNPDSDGILSSKNFPFAEPCNEVNRTTPYLLEYERDNITYKADDMEGYMSERIKALSKENVTFTDKNFRIAALDYVPDGAFTIKGASDKALKYNLHVHDLKYWQYHRNNGITKIGIVNP